MVCHNYIESLLLVSLLLCCLLTLASCGEKDRESAYNSNDVVRDGGVAIEESKTQNGVLDNDVIPTEQPKNEDDFEDHNRLDTDIKIQSREKRSEKFERRELDDSEKQTVSNYTKIIDELTSRSTLKYLISPFDYASNKKQGVTIKFSPFKVLSVDEREQSITVSSYVVVKWIDDALRWDPKKYGSISMISVKTSDLWTPDILLPRANGDGFRLTKPEYVFVRSNVQTNIRMATLFKFTISCNLDMSMYPFDTQTCPIMFVEEGDRPLKAFVTEDDEDNVMDFFGTSGEWEIQDKYLVDAENENPGFYFKHTIQYAISMKRRSAFYIANLLIPVYITSFISLFVFWIPPETGEKVSFMVSIYVSTAMYVSIINDVLPRSLTDLPSFNVIIVLVNVNIGLTFIATLIVLRLYRNHLEKESKQTGTAYDVGGREPETKARHNKCCTTDLCSFRKRASKIQEYRDKTVSLTPITFLDDPLGTRADESDDSKLNNCFPRPVNIVKSCLNWLDYRKLDKIFFGFFGLGYFFSLCIPWLVNLK